MESLEPRYLLTGGMGNMPPEAYDDYYWTAHDSTLTEWSPGVLGNDYDPDCNPLSASLVSGPTNGTLNYFNGDGSFEYEPNANFAGSDSFTYEVSDGTETAQATVYLDVFNSDPEAYDDWYYLQHDTVFADSDVLMNDFDGDGDALTASLVSGPTNGTLNYFNGDGSFEYEPGAGYVGGDSFVYEITDGIATAQATVYLDVFNSDPEAYDDWYSTQHDVPLTEAAPGVLGNDYDMDGDAISASLLTGPTNGTLTYFQADGSFEYVPGSGYAGSDSFVYEISDGVTTAQATVYIDVMNNAPEANDDTYSVESDEILDVDAYAGVLANDYDMDGDAMTLSLVTGPADAASFVLNSDGSFSFTPITDWDGVDQFIYAISDGIATVQATVFLGCDCAAAGAADSKKDTPDPGGSSAGAPSGTYVEGGHDVVAVYDNDDGVRPAGTADSDDFEEAADDFDNHYGAGDWAGLVAVLTTYVENNGLIDELFIFDHGYTGGGGQQFGDHLVTAAMWADLEPLLSDGATITLAGCFVGSNAAYADSVADATGANVSATAGLVKYRCRWFAHDYWADDGTWLTFDGTD